MAYKNLKTESVKKKRDTNKKNVNKKDTNKKVKSQKKPKIDKSKIKKVKVVIKKEIKVPIKKETISSEHKISDRERAERYRTLHAIAVNVVNNYNKGNRENMIKCMWCGKAKFYKSEACAKCGRF